MKTVEIILISMVLGWYSERIKYITSAIFYTITVALCTFALSVSVIGLIWGWFP